MSAPFIIPQAERERLLANGRLSAAGEELDPLPVVKLFTPDANATWLLTELDPDDPGIAFGLADLGLGSPELGFVSLAELASIRGRLGLPIERDEHFHPDKTLSAYATEARIQGRIIA
jgi:hypothetical protein